MSVPLLSTFLLLSRDEHLHYRQLSVLHILSSRVTTSLHFAASQNRSGFNHADIFQKIFGIISTQILSQTDQTIGKVSGVVTLGA